MPTVVSEVTYYDLEINTIVVEDDQPIDGLVGTPEEVIAQINDLPGGSVVTEPFKVIVLPLADGGPHDCEPEQMLPLPTLELIGSGDEDTEIPLKLKITPVEPYYEDLNDLISLPNGVVGDFGIGLSLPPGSSVTTEPPGGVVFDPITGTWVLDLSVLGVDPNDPTQTQGEILFTPPEHESSPTNPFDPAETFGPDDPYDELNTLEYSMVLNNFTCNTSTSGSGSFNLIINPVVDTPTIEFSGGNSFDEDTAFDLDLTITSPDGGERPGETVLIEVDNTNGGTLLDGDGNPLTGTDQGNGMTLYEVPYTDVDALQLRAAEHYSGLLDIKVTAFSQDIDFNTASATLSTTLNVIPVADIPTIEFDDTVIDPDTGQPFVDKSGVLTMVTAIEDVPLNLSTYIDATTPDQDGSETYTIVLGGVPDYLEVGGPAGDGLIDNGDGTYTIAPDAYSQVTLRLVDEHARLPDSLNAELPSQILLNISVNTLELANSDDASGAQNFLLKVRPDAGEPILTAAISPATGVEDAGDVFTVTMSAETPDPHETMHFEIAVPDGAQVFVDGAEVQVTDGVAIVEATAQGQVGSGNYSFVPIGTVTFVAPEDFGGLTTVDVTAVTTDADGIFTDTEQSDTQNLELDIVPSPDLELTVTDPDVELTETDRPVLYRPASDFDIVVTDQDGSEIVDTVTYTLQNIPQGMTYLVGTSTMRVTGTDLVFTGSEAEFSQLTLVFPRDYATNDAPLTGSINVTTNEGGNETGNFTVQVAGELDLTVIVDVTPETAPQTGLPIEIDFGIDAQVTDTQPSPSETLEEIVIQFDSILPAGTVASAGTIDGDRLTLTRGATSPADFAVLVAALSITLPGTAAGTLTGEITVTTNHGSADAEPFEVAINEQPAIAGPVEITSIDTEFTVTFDELLANASDPDEPLTVDNIMVDDPQVGVTVTATGVTITVPEGYVGTPTLSYDVIDSGPGPAQSEATAILDIDTLQMEADGSNTGPDGVVRDLMNNVNNTLGGEAVAKGTDGNDAVVLSAERPYDGITGFALQDGSDFVDLSAATRGFTLDLGAGDDWAIGSDSNDILIGGAGADTLQGGGGEDIFQLTDLSSADVILDFDEPVGFFPQGVDQIDLTSLVSLNDGETLEDHVGYDNTNGELTVDGTLAATVGTDGGGFAEEVEVIFNNASGAQETAVI